MSVVQFGQGGSDAQATPATTYATYQAELAAYNAAAITQVQSITGQSAPPLFEMFPQDTDNALQSSAQGIPQAQLDFAVANAQGNVVMVGGKYAVQNYGEHKTNNGERWFGSMRGKVRHKVMDLEQGWLPLMPMAITSRGDVILIDFHVPEPPLVWKPIYMYNTLALFGVQNGQILTPVTDAIAFNAGAFSSTITPGGIGGFVVQSTDGTPNPKMQSATIISDTSVLIQLDRVMSATSPRSSVTATNPMPAVATYSTPIR